MIVLTTMGLIPEELLIDEAKTEFLYFDASVKEAFAHFLPIYLIVVCFFR